MDIMVRLQQKTFLTMNALLYFINKLETYSVDLDINVTPQLDQTKLNEEQSAYGSLLDQSSLINTLNT